MSDIITTAGKCDKQKLEKTARGRKNCGVQFSIGSEKMTSVVSDGSENSLPAFPRPRAGAPPTRLQRRLIGVAESRRHHHRAAIRHHDRGGVEPGRRDKFAAG